MAVVGNLQIYLGANSSNAINGMKKADFAFNQLAKNFQRMETRLNVGIERVFNSVGRIGGIAEKVRGHLDSLKMDGLKFNEAGPLASLSKLTDGVLNMVNSTQGAILIFTTFKTVAGNAILSVARIAPKLGLALGAAAGPIGLIIGGISAIGVVVAQNFDLVVKYLTKAINWFRELYNENNRFRAAVESIKFVFQTLYEYGKAWFEFFKTGFSTVGRIIKAILNGEISSIGGIISEGFDRAAVAGKKFLDNTKKNFANASLNYLVNPKLEPLTEDQVRQGITGPLKSILERLGISLPVAFSGVEGAIETVRGTVNAVAPLMFKASVQVLSQGDQIYQKTLTALDGITQKFSFLGDKQAELKEKIRTTKNALLQMGTEGIDPTSTSAQVLRNVLAQLKNELDSLDGKNVKVNGFEETKQQVLDLSNTIKEGLGNAVSYLVQGLATGSASMKDAVKGVVGFFGGIMVQIGKNIVLAGKAIESLKVALGTFSGIGAIIAGGLLIGAGSLLKSVPAAAKGAVVSGDTLLRVGDNPNSHIDPEVVQPLSKLKSLIRDQTAGGVQDIRIKGLATGENLSIVNEEANYLNDIFR
tara:strand:- start:2857 stop:4617 length:1761 start_codon:yes stop_codon:yes gene_type:complete